MAVGALVAVLAACRPPGDVTNEGVDGGFGKYGIATAPFEFVDVAVQPDNKILVVGEVPWGESCSNATGCIALARFDAGGVIDQSFGRAGIATVDHPGVSGSQGGRAVEVLPTGKIIVLGDRDLVRLHPDGAVDAGFGSDGLMPTGLGTEATDMVVDSTGAIVMVGSPGRSGQDVVIERYLASGAPDAGFGSDGRTVVSIDVSDQAVALALAPGGKIVVGGYTLDTNITPFWNWRWFLLRVDQGGGVDSSFSQDGVVIRPSDGIDDFGDVVVQPDGKVFAIGESSLNTIVTRYDQAGEVDRSWGGTGTVERPLVRTWGNFSYDTGSSLGALDASGQLVTAGPFGSCYCPWAVVRWNPDGTYQPPMISENPATADTDYLKALEVAPDGKVIVGAGRTLMRYPAIRPVPAPVLAYAPIVYLHPDEVHNPMSASDFVSQSTLMWAHGANCGDDAYEGSVDQLKLGHGGYSNTTFDESCAPENEERTSADFTRPFDGWSDDEGFFLNYTGSWNGTGVSAPAYYEFVDRHYISYWFFYAYSFMDNPDPVQNQQHEGDWENVTVRLDRHNKPVAVAYYSHGGGPDLWNWPGHTGADPWNPADPAKVVDLEGTHPVVFSAKGSHASYATEGSHSTQGLPTGVDDDHTGYGARWDTANTLAPLTAQPWYGYRGAWGLVHYGVAVWPFSDTHFSGPLGPNPQGSKEFAPEEWNLCSTESFEPETGLCWRTDE